jgi:hypothetical protein
VIPEWLEYAAAVGNAVGGFAALGGVIYAVVEFRSWRNRTRGQDRAAAAQRALPALEAFSMAVTHWMNCIALAASQTRGQRGLNAVRNMNATPILKAALAGVEERQKELTASAMVAGTVLREEERSPLGMANTVYLQVDQVCRQAYYAGTRAEQEAALGRDVELDLAEVVDDSLKELQATLEAVVERGRAIFGAIARHERVPREALLPLPFSLSPVLKQHPSRGVHIGPRRDETEPAS